MVVVEERRARIRRSNVDQVIIVVATVDDDLAMALGERCCPFRKVGGDVFAMVQ